MVDMTNDKSLVDDNNDAINCWGRSQRLGWDGINLNQSYKKIETFGEMVVFDCPASMHTLWKYERSAKFPN